MSKLKIAYYTSGIAGSGRLVRGISIGNALKRKRINCEYYVLSSSSFAYLCDNFSIAHREIPLENEHILTKDNYSNSVLYQTLTELQPDILLIDLLWFQIYHFIRRLKCNKIFLCHQVFDDFFSLPLEEETLRFNPEHFDLLLAIEPFTCSIPMKQINPLLLRNRDEILSRDEAAEKLGLDKTRETCLYAFNNRPGDFEKYKKKYSHLEDLYQMVYTTNYEGGIFPIVDYFNAFDYIVCAAGYNMFWEVKYFGKNAAFEHVPLAFSSTKRRFEECIDYEFDINGADQLAEIIMKL